MSVEKRIDLRTTSWKNVQDIAQGSLNDVIFTGIRQGAFKTPFSTNAVDLDARYTAVKILDFARSRTNIKNVFSKNLGEIDGGDYQRNLEAVMGGNYHFTTARDYFKDMIKSLIKAGATDETMNWFRDNLHEAWKEVIQERKKIEVKYDTTDLTYTHLKLVSHKLFHPPLTEHFRDEYPYLGITNQGDLEKVIKQYQDLIGRAGRGAMTPSSEDIQALLLGQEVEQLYEEYREGKRPYILRREYQREQFGEVPYPDIINSQTESVSVDLLAEGTLWRSHDPNGISVVRIKKPAEGVTREVIKARVAELPDCVPKVRFEMAGKDAIFRIRYVNGRMPDVHRPRDVALVRESILKLNKLGWYLCDDCHSGNFQIASSPDGTEDIAYWVDQDIFDRMVENRRFTSADWEAVKKRRSEPWVKD